MDIRPTNVTHLLDQQFRKCGDGRWKDTNIVLLQMATCSQIKSNLHCKDPWGWLLLLQTVDLATQTSYHELVVVLKDFPNLPWNADDYLDYLHKSEVVTTQAK
jgi:hypothetical protein